jgi:hypothetical protein
VRLIPKNWESFQHYKDRAPPWIKLHHGLLDDRMFQKLPDASRALAPCLWLLASESKAGDFDGSIEELSFRVRQSEKWIEAALKPLIDKGFFVVLQDASEALAGCQQVAVPETEKRREETEAFATFWSAYPNKTAKPRAVKAFRSAKINGHLPDVLADIEARAQGEWCGKEMRFIPHPATYLNDRRWEDEKASTSAQIPGLM